MRTSSRPARGAEPVPLGGDGGEMGAGLLADDDPGVVRQAADPRQHCLGGGCEGDHAGACLAVAEAKLACGASTSSQRSVRISFRRQPVSMRRRSAAMA